MKEVLRDRFIAVSAYITNQEQAHKSSLTSNLKDLKHKLNIISPKSYLNNQTVALLNHLIPFQLLDSILQSKMFHL